MWEQYRLGPTIATLIASTPVGFRWVPNRPKRSESRYAEEAGKLAEIVPDGRAKTEA